MRKLSILFVLSCIFSAQAIAAKIDFDSAPLGSSNPLIIDGFRFDAISETYEFSPPLVGFDQSVVAESAGDNALRIVGTGGPGPFGNTSYISVTMTAADGGPFAFYGADFSTALYLDPAVMDAGITGHLVGGGFAAGPFGSGDWLNLESVEFYLGAGFLEGGGIQSQSLLEITIDNVNAQVVPLPAAAWLFASAIAGLGWLRRKQTA